MLTGNLTTANDVIVISDDDSDNVCENNITTTEPSSNRSYLLDKTFEIISSEEENSFNNLSSDLDERGAFLQNLGLVTNECKKILENSISSKEKYSNLVKGFLALGLIKDASDTFSINYHRHKRIDYKSCTLIWKLRNRLEGPKHSIFEGNLIIAQRLRTRRTIHYENYFFQLPHYPNKQELFLKGKSARKRPHKSIERRDDKDQDLKYESNFSDKKHSSKKSIRKSYRKKNKLVDLSNLNNTYENESKKDDLEKDSQNLDEEKQIRTGEIETMKTICIVEKENAGPFENKYTKSKQGNKRNNKKRKKRRKRRQNTNEQTTSDESINFHDMTDNSRCYYLSDDNREKEVKGVDSQKTIISNHLKEIVILLEDQNRKRTFDNVQPSTSKNFKKCKEFYKI